MLQFRILSLPEVEERGDMEELARTEREGIQRVSQHVVQRMTTEWLVVGEGRMAGVGIREIAGKWRNY